MITEEVSASENKVNKEAADISLMKIANFRDFTIVRIQGPNEDGHLKWKK